MSNQDGRLVKMERDCSSLFDAKYPAAEQLALNGQLSAAIESIMALEKTTRNAGDMATNVRVQISILQLCRRLGDWPALNDSIVALSKKHGALKQATQKMIEEAVGYVKDVSERESKLALIQTLRAVTEGKIYVEVERARLTRILSKMKEDEGNVAEAADILQELQVETYGSMEKREKTDFILEQMRLCLAKDDYTRTQIISRKVSKKFLALDESQDLKLRFYELMIRHATHEGKYLDACKYHRNVFSTPIVLNDPKLWQEALSHAAIFGVLAPHDSEQHEIIKALVKNHKLERISAIRKFLKHFTTLEVISWKNLENTFKPQLHETTIFDMKTIDGETRWDDLRKRVIEHNLRVIAMYYTNITFERLGQLLDQPMDEIEQYLSALVCKKTFFAKIDRPAKRVDFSNCKEPEDILNDWSNNIHELLKVLECTTHLITKEEMVNTVLKVAN